MKLYYRMLVLSNKKLKEIYRFKDKFQLAPYNDDENNKQVILEYSFKEPDKEKLYPCLEKFSNLFVALGMEQSGLTGALLVLSSLCMRSNTAIIDNAFALIRSEEILKLMSLFTNYQFTTEKEIDNKYERITGFNTYQANKMEHNPENQKNIITDTTPHPYILLEQYFNLKEKTRRKFYSACILYNNGLSLINEMSSLSFIAFASSIETLISYEDNKKEKCKKCNQYTYKFSQKFKDFLELYYTEKNQYLENMINRYNDYYSIRSSISHGNQLFTYDVSRYNWAIDENYIDSFLKEQNDLIEFSKITRTSLINWLLKRQDII